MNMENIIAQTEGLTVEQLRREYVDKGVARWGEDERSGLEDQAARKSLATLRLERICREAEVAGIDEMTLRGSLPAYEGEQYAANGALEDGIS